MTPLRPIAAYAEALARLMPRGRVWPEAGGRVWGELLAALAPELRRTDARTAKLIEEADPRTTTEGLEDWERVLGLPDPCSPGDATFTERRDAVAALLRMEGGASPAYFIGLAAALGHPVTITEHRPFICGLSPSGHQAAARPIGSPLMRFWWRVTVANRRVRWFQVGFGGSRAGRDSHVSIEFAEALECIFARLKPAQTRLSFSYPSRDFSFDFSSDFGA